MKKSIQIIALLSLFILAGCGGPPVSRETEKWQTFENTAFGYELKYPTGWTVQTLEENATVIFTDPGALGDVVKIVVEESNPENLPIAEWVKKQKWVSTEPIEKQFTSINASGIGTGIMQSATGTIYFARGTRVWRMENGTAAERKTVPQDTFLHMLSTFEFGP